LRAFHSTARSTPGSQGPSRLILVGTVDAVCRAIDRCIAEQPTDLPAALAK